MTLFCTGQSAEADTMTRIRAGVADSTSGLSGRSSACRTAPAVALDAAQIATVEFEKMGGTPGTP